MRTAENGETLFFDVKMPGCVGCGTCTGRHGFVKNVRVVTVQGCERGGNWPSLTWRCPRRGSPGERRVSARGVTWGVLGSAASGCGFFAM
ncbi:hypothetical protein [Nonomuraea dietziae]|uniref:hypothetical protein n=1 Tax=Nonomuraea dietziae TaxID=65515 RepID=UPI003CD08ABA